MRKFLDEILKKRKSRKSDLDAEVIFSEIIKEILGDQYAVTSVGHDAFESRHGHMDILDGTDQALALKKLLKIRKEERDKKNEFPNNLHEYLTFGCSDLMFIGVYEELKVPGEFEYYVKTPEVIYGLPAIIPAIMNVYPRLLNTTLKELEVEFDQTSYIWTFAEDCHCCG